MAYYNNIPTASQQASQTQSLIQANFMALSSFGNGYAELSNQIATPTFAAGNDGLYTKTYATTAKNELYIHRQSVDAPTDVPFSASILSNTAMASSHSGWTYLPSGLLIKWGRAQITSIGTTNIDVTAISGGPAFNRNFIIMVTPILNTGASPDFTVNLASIGQLVAGTFPVNCSGSTASNTYVNYIVLGV